MSKVEQIEAEIRKLSTSEMRKIRDWIDDVLEDQLQFTDEFEATVKQSEADMAEGRHTRVRKPGTGA